jgi:hypothetical protein
MDFSHALATIRAWSPSFVASSTLDPKSLDRKTYLTDFVTGALITASQHKIFSVTSRTVAGLDLLDCAASTGKALS